LKFLGCTQQLVSSTCTCTRTCTCALSTCNISGWYTVIVGEIGTWDLASTSLGTLLHDH